jgi:hypothetical protein
MIAMEPSENLRKPFGPEPLSGIRQEHVWKRQLNSFFAITMRWIWLVPS